MHTHAPASELHRLQQHVARVQRERGLARDATAILASASGSLEQRARECLGVRELAGHQVPLRLRTSGRARAEAGDARMARVLVECARARVLRAR